MTMSDVWTYRSNDWSGIDLTGYGVEAVTAASARSTRPPTTSDRSYIVVDTGPWIFGKKVMLPAGVIDRVDLDDENVYVDRTKDEIKDAPEFDEDSYHERRLPLERRDVLRPRAGFRPRRA